MHISTRQSWRRQWSRCRLRTPVSALLEVALTKLWGTQRRRTLAFARYHQMGGVHGALDRFANEKAVELTGTVAEVLDQVLLRLVRTLGGGSDLVIRQRVPQSTVSAAEWDALRCLADARLVVLGSDAADGEPYAEATEQRMEPMRHPNPRWIGRIIRIMCI